MISLFCKKALLNRRYSAKEGCNFKVPTIRSHPIVCIILQVISLYCRSFSAKEPLIIGLCDKMTCRARDARAHARERERQRERARERECVCVCVKEKEDQRARKPGSKRETERERARERESARERERR